jgi:hypothetical protein
MGTATADGSDMVTVVGTRVALAKSEAFGPCPARVSAGFVLGEIAPELTGHGLPLSKCEAYNRVYDQF